MFALNPHAKEFIPLALTRDFIQTIPDEQLFAWMQDSDVEELEACDMVNDELAAIEEAEHYQELTEALEARLTELKNARRAGSAAATAAAPSPPTHGRSASLPRSLTCARAAVAAAPALTKHGVVCQPRR